MSDLDLYFYSKYNAFVFKELFSFKLIGIILNAPPVLAISKKDGRILGVGL